MSKNKFNEYGITSPAEITNEQSGGINVINYRHFEAEPFSNDSEAIS